MVIVDRVCILHDGSSIDHQYASILVPAACGPIILDLDYHSSDLLLRRYASSLLSHTAYYFRLF